MKEQQLLKTCRDIWGQWATFRSNRRRYKRYTYGNQWSDLVRTPEGKWKTESEYLTDSGYKPYTNNLIRQLVKSIVGRYRMECADGDSNRELRELDSRMLEEFLISGAAIQRIGTKLIENISPSRFFCNPPADPRCNDITVAGTIHDLTFAEIVERFGATTPGGAVFLSECFNMGRQSSVFGKTGDIYTIGNDPFLSPASGRCRVIEVWTLDCCKEYSYQDPRTGCQVTVISGGMSAVRKNLNGVRRNMRPRISVRYTRRWQCRWLAPDGTRLDAYMSPYSHGSHPFAVKFYPLLDGEIHPFVEDVIDQQRFINRLIVMMDRMLMSSAKGVLLYPLDQLPDGLDIKTIADAWSSCNSVVPVTGRGQELPRQIFSNSHNEGAYRLLDLQMKMLDNISGVGDVLMGRAIPSNVGASMYEAQIKNSQTSIADLIETFNEFIAQRNCKIPADNPQTDHPHE